MSGLMAGTSASVAFRIRTGSSHASNESDVVTFCPTILPLRGGRTGGTLLRRQGTRMAAKSELILRFSEAAEWDAWLARNHDRTGAVLLRIPKQKGSDLTYARALDTALAWGWIDSQKRALDATAWLQRFSPRVAKSPWSKINRARADGRWTRAYDSARSAQVPSDLASALARNSRARTFFDALDRANRYAILWRVQTAKRPETRARRIEQFVALCASGRTLHPTSRDGSRGKRK